MSGLKPKERNQTVFEEMLERICVVANKDVHICKLCKYRFFDGEGICGENADEFHGCFRLQDDLKIEAFKLVKQKVGK